jgi:hypothetical protein
VGVIRKDARTASDVFLTTTLHPMRVRTLTVVLVTPDGAKTMTKTLSLVRPAAPATISRRAEPTPSLADTTDPQAIHLHISAANALATALHMLRAPECDTAMLQAATGRAIRAATTLKRLCQVRGVQA